MKKITIILTTAILALQANSSTIKDEVRVTSSTPTIRQS